MLFVYRVEYASYKSFSLCVITFDDNVHEVDRMLNEVVCVT